jgi:alpha-L-rhamnosidase
LSEHGYHEQAYRVVTQKTAPGYGWMIQRGCTCLTEDWYGGGSQNHVMFGDISAWFYQYLAGIQVDPEIPGFKHFFLRPQPAGDLTWVKSEHRSPFGLIKASWEKQPNGDYKAHFTVPVGSKATIVLPDGHSSEMTPGEANFLWRDVQK